MQIRMDQMDWNQLRAFLETAETGSLSAAARKLGLTQPTLSRQVAAIERDLGVTLFERVGKAMALTTTGMDLLEHARAMGAAAEALGLAANGRSQAVGGVVSVSATDAVAALLLPPLVRQLHEQEPGIAIEVISSNALSDLLRREAGATRSDRASGARSHGLLLCVRRFRSGAWPSAHLQRRHPPALRRR